MKRPDDAPLFLAELSKALADLERQSDVLALGYVSQIYHIAATYGLVELTEPIETAFGKIYERYQKDDSVKLHYLISMLCRFPKWSADKVVELEDHIERLNMPDITRDLMRVLKINVEGYKNEVRKKK
jgi:hypothetical protein